MENTNVYVPHAAVRLIKVSPTLWRISQLFDKKEYSVEPLVAAIITLFSGGETLASFLGKAKQVLKLENDSKIMKIVKHLISQNILVFQENENHQQVKSLIEKWSKYGWREAADYYLGSLAYPFIEGTVYQYNKDDNARMASYYQQEPDSNRSKEYENCQTIKTPTARELLESAEFQANLDSALNASKHLKNSPTLTLDHVFKLAAISFGKLRERKIMDGVADAVRKTSPSGGSRHPTEGYIIVNTPIDGLAKGVYHFSVAKNALEKISDAVSDTDLQETYPGIYRKCTPKLIVVFTSLFERNMYRYREPRTFRSIFVDVGHVCETVRLVTQAMGFQCAGHTYVSYSNAEKMLKINPLEEGVIYTLGVF